VLGRHSEIRDMTEVLFEERAVAARDDVDNVSRVGSENLERLEQALGGRRGRWVLDDRSEGAVVVEHEEATLGRRVLGDDGLFIEQGSVLRGLLALQRLEQLEDVGVGPNRRGLALDGPVQDVVTSLALLEWHLEARIDSASDAAEVPRVDLDRLAQDRRDAGELGDDEGALGFGLADDVLHAASERDKSCEPFGYHRGEVGYQKLTQSCSCRHDER
jgi:hypothetical protein